MKYLVTDDAWLTIGDELLHPDHPPPAGSPYSPGGPIPGGRYYFGSTIRTPPPTAVRRFAQKPQRNYVFGISRISMCFQMPFSKTCTFDWK